MFGYCFRTLALIFVSDFVFFNIFFITLFINAAPGVVWSAPLSSGSRCCLVGPLSSPLLVPYSSLTGGAESGFDCDLPITAAVIVCVCVCVSI